MTSQTIEELLARLERLEAESEIRRLVAANQWSADWSSEGVDVPHWAANPRPTASPVAGMPVAGMSEGPPRHRLARTFRWKGSGLSSGFEGQAELSISRTDSGEIRVGTPAGVISSPKPREAWMPDMMHFLTNENITVTSSSTAIGRWYSWEPSTVVVDSRAIAIWIAGRYEGAFVKEDGEWRIQEMHFQEIFSTPFDGSGWVDTPHVRYGPKSLTAGSEPE